MLAVPGCAVRSRSEAHLICTATTPAWYVLYSVKLWCLQGSWLIKLQLIFHVALCTGWMLH